jgi:Fe-S-cluster containining protein
MSVAHPDSVEKVILKYFASITKVSFTVGNTVVTPRPLIVSWTLARGYECPQDCGACCPKFTLDYIPEENKPDSAKERLVEFNGKQIQVFSDIQMENNGTHCKYVSMPGARCAIHPVRPFSCDFELVRFYMGTTTPNNRIGLGPFGRSWNLTRAMSTEKGTCCVIKPPTEESIQDTIRKLQRLQAWAQHFGLLETWIPEIIEFLTSTKGQAGNRKLTPPGYEPDASAQPPKRAKFVSVPSAPPSRDLNIIPFRRTKTSKPAYKPGDRVKLSPEQAEKYSKFFESTEEKWKIADRAAAIAVRHERDIWQEIVSENPEIEDHQVYWNIDLKELVILEDDTDDTM